MPITLPDCRKAVKNFFSSRRDGCGFESNVALPEFIKISEVIENSKESLE
tara:strand:- start:1485 stop:1634 length:150 start_codon:yes stop_codon:yes gene_type:complete